MSENTIHSVTVLIVAVTVALAMFATPVAATSPGAQGVMPGDNVQFPGSEWAPGGENFPDSLFDGVPGQGDDHFPDSLFDGGDKDGSDPVITK